MDDRVRRILRLSMPSTRRFLPGLLSGIMSAGAAVALLASSAYLITKAGEQPSIVELGVAVVGVRAFALARAAFRYLERLLSHDAAFRQLAELRAGMVGRIIPVAPDGLQQTGRGDLLTRLVSDVDELQNVPLRVVQPLLISGIVALGSVVLVWIVHPPAGIALALCLILAFAVSWALVGLVAAKAERQIAPLRGAVSEAILDLVSNLDVLTAYGAVDGAKAKVVAADDALTRATVRRAAGAGIAGAVVSLAAGLATVAALWFGIPSLGAIGGPALTVIALVPLAVFEVCGMVPLALGAWREARASAERVAAAVPDEVPAGIPDDALGSEILPGAVRSSGGSDSAEHQDGTDAAPASAPTIVVEQLTARWPGAEVDALAPVSFTIAAGDRLLVTGDSGAGKTTLAHSLVRFLDHGGSYRIDGVDVSSLRPDAVRSVLGLIEQRPFLFDADIRQNLLFARDTSTDDELEAVLDRVGLGTWLVERGGLDASVGEHGGLVSGGQAQRIALARALLRDFPVLVLDEPTANVDPERADALLADLLGAADADRRAIIVISHTPVAEELVTQRLRLEPVRTGVRPAEVG
ncbi:thiol reductant ABC exporter subunit CydC [Plantibacter sp. Mn2098]|uniref:thiol reductant ABC exporter subunit CydC n=1 Tax=Plantibacter sp. Mn2098 TaxID=3395266 RepID=UPI003BC9535B